MMTVFHTREAKVSAWDDVHDTFSYPKCHTPCHDDGFFIPQEQKSYPYRHDHHPHHAPGHLQGLRKPSGGENSDLYKLSKSSIFVPILEAIV